MLWQLVGVLTYGSKNFGAGKVRNMVKQSGCKTLLWEQTRDLKLVASLLNALE